MRIQTSQKAEWFAQSFRRGLLGVFALFACALSLSLVRPHQALAATNATINFQARLETASGAIVPDGTYNVEFKLYSAATGGTAEWTEDYTYNSGPGATDARLRVANGYLTANLGSITSFPGTINWTQQQWLTMNIGGTVSSGTITWDGEMSPRLQLTAVPYAFDAGTLSTTDGSNNSGVLSFDTVTNNPVITLPNASGTICLQSSSACGFATGSGTAFLQGGNSFGAQGVLGTNDSNSLAIRTAGTNRLVIDTVGNLQLQKASTFNIASAAGGSQLTIQAGAATSGTNVGGNLLLQGGAGASTGASGSVIVKANTNNTTTAFAVQAAGGANLFTVDSQNTAIVLGTDGTPTALTVRGGAATGSNAQGANITFDASNGTGDAGSGDLIFRTSPTLANPISLDATSSSTAGSGTTLSWSHTTGSESNMILIVGVGSDTGPVNSVSSVTYNGVSLARVVSEGCPSSGSNCDEELWYLVNPSPGSHAISVTLGVSGEIFGGAATYYGVNTTASLGTAAVNQGVGGPTYVAVSSNSTQLVIDGVMDPANGSLNSPNAGQTKLWEPNLYGLNSGGSSKPGASGTTTLGWGLNYNSWAEVGVPLNPIPNTASDVLTDRLHITAAGNVGIDNANPQYTLDVAGTARVQTAANSTTAFQVQNAAGINLLTADSTNKRIIIGAGSAGESTPSLLVLDSQTGSSTDPTGVNGAMYYNATSNAFRCDVNSNWQNCTPGVGFTFSTVGGASGTQTSATAGTILIAPLYVSGQITVNTMRVEVTTALGAAGDVGVYNAAGALVLDGGSGSHTTTTGLHSIVPTQSTKVLEPGQYYVAITWNSTTGAIATNTLPIAGVVPRAGTIAGGGNALPSSLTLSNITTQAYEPLFTLSN